MAYMILFPPTRSTQHKSDRTMQQVIFMPVVLKNYRQLFYNYWLLGASKTHPKVTYRLNHVTKTRKKHVYASHSQHITLKWGIKTYEDLVTAYGLMPITSSRMHEIRTAGSELNKFFSLKN